MTVYDDLISILFKLPDGRNLEEYFKNILLVAKFDETDMVDGAVFPSEGIKKYSSYQEVLEDFLSTSQVAIEAYAVFNQKSNSQTTSQVMYLIVAKQNTSESVAETLDKAKAADGKFVKVVPTSRLPEDIKAVAQWCSINDRFCDFVVTSTEAVADIVKANNNHAYAIFRKNSQEAIASAVASTSTCGKFGAKSGSAQFTQLNGILPETYTTGEISAMKSNNIAYYTNVSPIEGGETSGFGYNWVMGSRMLGGELRQRQMIMHYIKKSMGLMALEFFNKKPMYDETGNNLLLTLAQKRFKSFQEYNLVIPTTADQIGYELKVTPIRVGSNSIMNTDVEAYEAKKYKLTGYYYDAIVGEKVDFTFTIDPTEEEVAEIIGGDGE